MAVGFSDDQFMVGSLTGPIACHTHVTQQRFIQGASALNFNPLIPFIYHF